VAAVEHVDQIFECQILAEPASRQSDDPESPVLAEPGPRQA
jgi:hypothetical protein